MMTEIANAQLSTTLNGVKLQTANDYLEINITSPFNLGTDITSLTSGFEKRNETYYPFISFIVLNNSFWIEEVDVITQDCINLETEGFNCTDVINRVNRTKKLHFTLGFNRDITKEYIEGWDWHNVNLGRDYSFDADFRCYSNNSMNFTGNFEARNTKQRQINIDVGFNFTGVNVNDKIRCEDPIYSVKKFFDEFTDLSQWSNDALGNWFAESGVACSGVGCAGGGACTAAGSNMSITYDIDLSNCVNNTAYVNFTASESGTSDPEDCLNSSYSIDSGTTWIRRNTTFCDDLTAITAYGFKIPNVTYSSQFRWRFQCQNFQAASENVNIQRFNITCNSSTVQVSQCGNLNTGNVQYNLRKNVNSTGTCFNITAQNNTLDCHGFMINYSTTEANVNTYGVSIEHNYTTVRSCDIGETTEASPFSSNHRKFGVFLQGSYNSIYNNTIRTHNDESYTITNAGSTNAIGASIINNSIYSNKLFYQNVDDLIQGRVIFFVDSSENPLNANNSIYDNEITQISPDSLSAIRLNNGTLFRIFRNNITGLQSSIDTAKDNAGLLLSFQSTNHSIFDNKINVTNTSAITIFSSAIGVPSNNTFINNLIISKEFGIEVVHSLSTGSPTFTIRNNFFINNTIIPCSDGCASGYKDIIFDGNITDMFFINTSFNKSNVQFTLDTGEYANMTVKWFLTINISNSTGQPIPAQVIINDSNNLNILNETAATNGLTRTIEITEYTQNGTVPFGNNDSCIPLRNHINITCFSPFNMSANMSGYTSNATSIEMNRSRLVNLFLGITSAEPPPAETCTCPASGNWVISDGSICMMTSNCNLGSNRLRIINGKLHINNGLLRAVGCFIANAQSLFVKEGARLYCGD